MESIISSGVIIHLSNAAPRLINIFLKSIEAKIQLMEADGNTQTTPISKARLVIQLTIHQYHSHPFLDLF